MGIFSDRCDALIDPATGRALEGFALEQARKNGGAPRCGARVSKRAKFCSRCGRGAPGGWIRCPNCGKWVGNDSTYCAHCSTPLYPDDRVAIAGGVWRRDPGTFAQRFEAGDIRRVAGKELYIQEGAKALLLDGGKVTDILESGRHSIEGLLRTVNWFGNPPPRSVVLVEGGDIALPFEIKDLRTSEHFPITFYGEVALRFKAKKDAAVAFLENALKAGREMQYQEIADRVQPVVRHAVDAMCVKSTVDDLVRDPERRIRLQEEMARQIGEDLDRWGIEVVRVTSAEFTGKEYEAYAARNGKIDIDRRMAEFNAAARKIRSGDIVDAADDRTRRALALAELNQEYRVAHGKMEHEWQMQLCKWWDENRKFYQGVEIDDLEHQAKVGEGQIKIRELWDAYERRKKELSAKSDISINAAWADEQIRQAMQWVLVKKEKDAAETKRLWDLSQVYKGMSIEEMMLFADDPAKRADLLRIFTLKMNAGMTPQQILADACKTNPVAAQALAMMSSTKVADAERLITEFRAVYDKLSGNTNAQLATIMPAAVAAASRPSGVSVNSVPIVPPPIVPPVVPPPPAP